MKTLIALLFFFASLNCCFGQKDYIKIDLEETVYLNKRTCCKKSGEPLNGNYAVKINKYQTNYEPFVDGLKNGEVRIYRNKKLVEKGVYINNLRENIWKYFNQDGTIDKLTNYKNGLRDSIEVDCYNNAILQTNTYYKNHLNGWAFKYGYTKPHQIIEKSFYVNDKKITNITYKKIDSLNFTIVDSLFYNDKKQLILKKSFVNDTLKLQIEIKYDVIIKDVINIETTQVNVYEGEKLNMTYYFPIKYEYMMDDNVVRILIYEFAFYTDTRKTRLLFLNPEEPSYDKDTFYRQFPNGEIQSVTYQDGDGDILPGWYYRDVNR